ncbi:hypothetical protein ACFYVR_23490 [Rhodococcus sp. NPDC003318]|uniref:hypothetical protein n=1 Tax=Rhodococcus sp. NPDC003318 TaxID=3364503 RepID=UPI0036BD02AE
MPYQDRWQRCVNCQVLFFNGHADGNKGKCSGSPNGQGHYAGGDGGNFSSYELAHDEWVESAQDSWRNCWNCQAMYFDGHSDGNKGHCPAGGAHDGHGSEPSTYNFTLPFNVADNGVNVRNWRNCWKCQAMVFDGDPDDKGRCAADGGTHECHADIAWNFVLPWSQGIH